MRLAPLVLLVLATPALADEVQVWRYTFDLEVVDARDRSQIVVEARGELRSHPLGDLEGAQQWLNERRAQARELKKVVINGAELPVDLVASQAGPLSRPQSRLELESFGPADSSALHWIQVALDVQRGDEWIVAGISQLCQRDWERVRREARGSPELVWELPALYRAFRVEEQPTAQADLRQVSATLPDTTCPGRMGDRTLRGFRFQGLYDLVGRRFLRTEMRGEVENARRGLRTRVHWIRERGSPWPIPAAEANTWRPQARLLAAAVGAAEQGRTAEAHALFQRAQAPSFLAETTRLHAGRVAAMATGVPWQQGAQALERALVRSRAEGRPVLVLIDQLRCPASEVMWASVLTHPDFVAEVEAGFIPVRLDLCREPALMQRYQVQETPTLLVLDRDGNVVSRQVGINSLSASLGLLDEGRAFQPR